MLVWEFNTSLEKVIRAQAQLINKAGFIFKQKFYHVFTSVDFAGLRSLSSKRCFYILCISLFNFSFQSVCC